MKTRTKQLVILTIIVALTSTIIPNVKILATTLPEDEYNIELLPNGTLGMDWTLQEVITGTTMSFSGFQGKVVLLDFFATWCGPCRTFADELIEVRNQFSASKLVVISLDTDPDHDDVAAVKAFAEEEGMTWYIFRDTKGISTFYQIESIPTIYILNAEQRVTFSSTGVLESSIIINQISSLIPNEQTTPTSGGTPVTGFWAKNWYWFVILGVFLIVGVSVYIQRVRVINQNKKIRKEEFEEKQRRRRKRLR